MSVILYIPLLLILVQLIPMQGQSHTSNHSSKRKLSLPQPPSPKKQPSMPVPILKSLISREFNDFGDLKYRQEMNSLCEEIRSLQEEAAQREERLKQRRQQNIDLEQVCLRTGQINSLLDLSEEQRDWMREVLSKFREEPGGPSYAQLFDQALISCLENRKRVEGLKMALDEAQKQIAKNQEQLRKIRLEKQIEQGIIRVYCRIRPLAKEQGVCCSIDDGKIKSTIWKNNRHQIEYPHDKIYEVDHIFSQATKQEEVFVQLQESIDVAIDGSTVCLFAYGQTGSGKSFTMHGNPTNEKGERVVAELGLSFRALSRVLATLEQEKKTKDIDYQCAVAAYEISFKGKMDLLAQTPMNGKNPLFFLVNSVQKAEAELRKAIQSRTTSRTDMNNHSSRTHMFFIIQITRKLLTSTNVGRICIIDLAGSQRASQEKSMEETKFINESLSSLITVLNQLADKQPVTYNNSPLTVALKPYLNRTTITTIIINLSSDKANSAQTKSSLEIAEKVRRISKK